MSVFWGFGKSRRRSAEEDGPNFLLLFFRFVYKRGIDSDALCLWFGGLPPNHRIRLLPNPVLLPRNLLAKEGFDSFPFSPLISPGPGRGPSHPNKGGHRVGTALSPRSISEARHSGSSSIRAERLWSSSPGFKAPRKGFAVNPVRLQVSMSRMQLNLLVLIYPRHEEHWMGKDIVGSSVWEDPRDFVSLQFRFEIPNSSRERERSFDRVNHNISNREELSSISTWRSSDLFGQMNRKLIFWESKHGSACWDTCRQNLHVISLMDFLVKTYPLNWTVPTVPWLHCMCPKLKIIVHSWFFHGERSKVALDASIDPSKVSYLTMPMN